MTRKKGLELPVNMIIVIAIAVLVLVVIAAFFAGQTGSGINSIALENAYSNTCNSWRSQYACSGSAAINLKNTVNFYKPGTSGQTGTNQDLASMSDLCGLKGYQIGGSYDDPKSCERNCGCPRPTGTP